MGFVDDFYACEDARHIHKMIPFENIIMMNIISEKLIHKSF